MIRGKTEVETLKLNGWGVGDVLEGIECGKPQRIKIIVLGDERFICRWDNHCTGDYGEENGSTTLSCRDWYKISEPQSKDQTQ